MDLLRFEWTQIDLGKTLLEEEDVKDAIHLGGTQSDLAMGKGLANSKEAALKAEFATRIGLAEKIVGLVGNGRERTSEGT